MIKIIFLLLLFIIIISIIVIIYKKNESFSQNIPTSIPYKPDERCKNYYEIQLKSLKREHNRIIDGKQNVINILLNRLEENNTNLDNCNIKTEQYESRLLPYIISDQKRNPARITELFCMRRVDNLIINIVGTNFGQKDDWKIRILQSSGILIGPNQNIDGIINKDYITVYGNDIIEIVIPNLVFLNPKSVKLELVSSFDDNIKSNSIQKIF